jgi:hypothetical protein
VTDFQKAPQQLFDPGESGILERLALGHFAMIIEQCQAAIGRTDVAN